MNNFIDNRFVNHTDQSKCMNCGNDSTKLITTPREWIIGFPICNECDEFFSGVGYYSTEEEYFFSSAEEHKQYVINNILKLYGKGNSTV